MSAVARVLAALGDRVRGGQSNGTRSARCPAHGGGRCFGPGGGYFSLSARASSGVNALAAMGQPDVHGSRNSSSMSPSPKRALTLAPSRSATITPSASTRWHARIKR